MKLLQALTSEGSERELALALDPARIPAHIAIIMDGNGRWAKRRGLPRFAGHRAGVAMVRSVVEDCSRLGVKALTLYAFSAENWKRPRAEVDMLWRLLRYYLRHELEDLQRNDVRFARSEWAGREALHRSELMTNCGQPGIGPPRAARASTMNIYKSTAAPAANWLTP